MTQTKPSTPHVALIVDGLDENKMETLRTFIKEADKYQKLSYTFFVGDGSLERTAQLVHDALYHELTSFRIFASIGPLSTRLVNKLLPNQRKNQIPHVFCCTYGPVAAGVMHDRIQHPLQPHTGGFEFPLASGIAHAAFFIKQKPQLQSILVAASTLDITEIIDEARKATIFLRNRNIITHLEHFRPNWLEGKKLIDYCKKNSIDGCLIPDGSVLGEHGKNLVHMLKELNIEFCIDGGPSQLTQNGAQLAFGHNYKLAGQQLYRDIVSAAAGKPLLFTELSFDPKGHTTPTVETDSD